jgi:hypothetical protein
MQFSLGVTALLWLALIPTYYFYEYIGTKNHLAINKLKSVEASNTGVMMYLTSTFGTALCVYDFPMSLVNLIPIIIGAWLGSYFVIEGTIKLKRKNGKKRNTTQNKVPHKT